MSPFCFSFCCFQEMEHLSGIFLRFPTICGVSPVKENHHCSEVAALKWQHQSPFGLLIEPRDFPTVKALSCLLMEDSLASPPGPLAWQGNPDFSRLLGLWGSGPLFSFCASSWSWWPAEVSNFPCRFCCVPGWLLWSHLLGFLPRTLGIFPSLAQPVVPPSSSLVESPVVTWSWGGRKSAISFPSNTAKLCFLLHSSLLFLILRAYFGFF